MQLCLISEYVCILSNHIEVVDIWSYITVAAVSRHLPGPLPLGEGKMERQDDGAWRVSH